MLNSLSSGVATQEKSWLQQKNFELSRETASEQNRDQVQQENMGKKEVGVEEEEEVGKEMEAGEEMEVGEEVGEEMGKEIEAGEEEEIRMRRHSPRMTLPMQRKEESTKKQDVAGEELRRVSPRFQGGVGKVSKEAEEAKMYLFGLV